MKTLNHAEYTIGWICALRDELTAAMAMLDEPHEQLSQPRTDKNSYALGRIGKHNVVLAGLPSGKTGKVSAAIVATHLHSTFPAIRYVLMVGIAGGVPSDVNDIRLGDIVVGIPGPKNSGVVQYDFGKTIDEGVFIQTGALDSPPSGLLAAITNIRARHRLSKYGYIEHLQRSPQDLDPEFARPDEDLNFEVEYNHKIPGAPTCKDCDKEKLRKLAPRDPPVPRVFYGTIASADQVMRHGLTRDRIAEQCGALCFEMEVAGLINDFPCMVVRGICDYADTHKTKKWQPYAALAASAYAKEILEHVAPEDVSLQAPISSKLSQAATVTDTDQNLGVERLRSLDISAPRFSEASGELEKNERNSTEDSDFYSHLNKKVLESNTVALGQPTWDDYDALGARPSDDQIGISVQDRFQDILQRHDSGKQSEELGSRFASILRMANSAEALQSAAEKTYVLRSTEDWLKSSCAKQSTRSWLEKCIKKSPSVFMVVGIHTASNFPISTNEVIVAVQYRQVDFNWLWSRNVDSARLSLQPNIWQPSFITRGPADEDTELVQVLLRDLAEEGKLPETQIILNDKIDD